MIEAIVNHSEWTPFAFAFLIGLSMLAYATLDGYDLGVGILSRGLNDKERELAIGSIGPFWDANETWLVLGVGLLLVAFPVAHGIVLSALYLPVALMIIALILRGVSFDFRKKVAPEKQPKWNRIFFWSSLVVALSQGYMVGRFVTGLQTGWASQIFAAFFGLLVVAGYILMGSTWLIFKCEGELQQQAIRSARRTIWVMVSGAILSSIAIAFVDERIFERLFSFPEITLLSMMPMISIGLTLLMHFLCGVMPLPQDRLAWMPFAISVLIFALGFVGLVYSFYPYIIPGRLYITEAAAAPESLLIILIGTLIVLPFLVGYTLLAYYIFRGKARDLSYD